MSTPKHIPPTEYYNECTGDDCEGPVSILWDWCPWCGVEQ